MQIKLVYTSVKNLEWCPEEGLCKYQLRLLQWSWALDRLSWGQKGGWLAKGRGEQNDKLNWWEDGETENVCGSHPLGDLEPSLSPQPPLQPTQPPGSLCGSQAALGRGAHQRPSHVMFLPLTGHSGPAAHLCAHHARENGARAATVALQLRALVVGI